jgi:hypothetical protein
MREAHISTTPPEIFVRRSRKSAPQEKAKMLRNRQTLTKNSSFAQKTHLWNECKKGNIIMIPPTSSPTLRTFVLNLLPSMLLNGACVFVVYQLAKHFTSASDVVALFLSALPAMIGTIITLIRQRRVDVLGAFALVAIAASLGLTFMTGDARLLLIRESFLTMLFGVICLVSLLFPKPVWYYRVLHHRQQSRADSRV